MAELRLLKLVSDPRERILKFQVLEDHRDYIPPYTAVLYSWGDGQASEQSLLCYC